MSNKKLNILAFTNDTASRKWRFDGIASRLHQHTQHEMYVTSWQNWNHNTLGADLVIIELLHSVDMVDECHQQGAKVIYEADDAMIDTYGKERKNLQEQNEVTQQRAKDTVNKVDAVTVTNTLLAENFQRFTDKTIYVLPNYMDFEWYSAGKINVPRNSDEVRIGWFGSRGHFEDLRALIPAIKKVLDKYPQAKFVYCGYGGMSSDKLATEIGWGEDVFKEIPRHRREFVTGVEEDYWAIKHATLDLDIGIAPLIDDYFNHCKTPIKFFEYAAMKTPGVFSPVVYGEHPTKDEASVVTHGKNGFIANSPDEWVEYLSLLVESAKLRRKMGKAAYKTVRKEWDLENNWKKFLEVWEKVASRD